MTTEIAFLIAQWAIKFGIPAARKIAAIFYDTSAVTLDMWNATFDSAEKPYEDYVAPRPQ